MGKKEFNQFRGKAISLHSQGVAPPTPKLLAPCLPTHALQRPCACCAAYCCTVLSHLCVPDSVSVCGGAVIKEFGKNVGVDNKQVQGLIRLAKQNGEKLGFLS